MYSNIFVVGKLSHERCDMICVDVLSGWEVEGCLTVHGFTADVLILVKSAFLTKCPTKSGYAMKLELPQLNWTRFRTQGRSQILDGVRFPIDSLDEDPRGLGSNSQRMNQRSQIHTPREMRSFQPFDPSFGLGSVPLGPDGLGGNGTQPPGPERSRGLWRCRSRPPLGSDGVRCTTRPK